MSNWFTKMFVAPKDETEYCPVPEDPKNTMITMNIDHILDTHLGMQLFVDRTAIVEIRKTGDNDFLIITNKKLVKEE